MRATVIRLAVTVCALSAVACGGRDASQASTQPVTVGTSGTEGQLITVSGCLTSVPPDGYMLTSLDDAIERQERGTSGHHQNDPDTKPSEPNRGAENERARHEQNPSSEFGRYRLAGDQSRIAMFVNREIDVRGRVEAVEGDNRTPATLHVEAIDATGASCGDEQERGNDRGILPGQDLPRKLPGRR
jgi:hypothetical protein